MGDVVVIVEDQPVSNADAELEGANCCPFGHVVLLGARGPGESSGSETISAESFFIGATSGW